MKSNQTDTDAEMQTITTKTITKKTTKTVTTVITKPSLLDIVCANAADADDLAFDVA